jgi:hypothetical protein
MSTGALPHSRRSSSHGEVQGATPSARQRGAHRMQGSEERGRRLRARDRRQDLILLSQLGGALALTALLVVPFWSVIDDLSFLAETWMEQIDRA